MSEPWVTIVGLGEDGLSGLSDASRSALTDAEIIFGGPRHLELACAGPKGQPWPVPFSTDPVLAARGRKVVVLASGDPFWFGAGGSLMRDLAPGDWCSHPAPSCFALAANHLGWKLEETLCFGLHAAPFERLAPVLSTGVRVICTLRDGKAVADLAEWLAANGHAAARVHVMTRLGGPAQEVTVGAASDLTAQPGGGAPVLAAIEATNPGLPRASGLADSHFANDGQITKRPIRALTLSALAPRPGELLWDIGGGSGSISAEWCLAAPGARAVTFEPRAERLENIAENARRFGLSHRMTPVLGRAPDVLAGQPLPDVVFIGGGGRRDLLEHLRASLPTGTRLVANGVTLETETLLMQTHAEIGGHLMKVEIAEAAPLGTLRGWARARPVIQWSVTL
ncbi:Precorrin-6Y C(5,15)-methyltransferase [decarboxylating] [Tritonibacter multivorans]|uniref:Precorrin-6Y C(5,15)-methyltransferase [decarboxylating] n=1 Tax=Tritonibacter multivorans TaxID=928856 RepID=A0A0P1G105_9RHOB|nr:bifunctional cobalt-precorrin-7 (C(5))-methyltransferase/cobalt-precorrin-6B (C(15))-methyltransferase [Tritonibacter multivorans]MDA7419380.1 bifunctional cobalt-precorrin-7 (C(5))-methyltransferase/cobalt-precorrin-6B (C(15))-methyltransferase [Tritonibacter multivorans]CUH75349.1 Precorrin-6Y C(5,15)-methyltransferase [decarboxylating] [Tritonibacter multivorans]SFD20837.1 precorrin-6Y C5,15-methyltransferase (decarboxylating) [Tritonibacter multivorans]